MQASVCYILEVKQWRDAMYLSKFISPGNHDYYRNLKTNRHDGSSNVCDEEMYYLCWWWFNLTITIAIMTELLSLICSKNL